jgi:hypothetical protein
MLDARRAQHSLLLERVSVVCLQPCVHALVPQAPLVQTALTCNTLTGESVWVRPVAVRVLIRPKHGTE